MIFILQEKDAAKIFGKYKNCCAFTVGKAKAYTDNEIVVNYKKLGITPDEDTINAVLNGDLKAKKVIARDLKAMCNPKTENATIGIAMATLITMLDSKFKAKRGPVCAVFVLDNEDGDKAVKARNKFLTRWLTAMVQAFGIEPITDKKAVKKMFDCKRKKVVKKVIDYRAEHKETRISREGVTLKNLLLQFYNVELRQSALSELEVGEMNKETRNLYAENLMKIYTAENLKAIDKMDIRNKAKDKYAKKLSKKDKTAVEAYKTFAAVLASMDSEGELKLPKVKYGASKKGPKMKTKKFMKFFTKKDNANLLGMLYAHTCCVLMGVEIGSGEYGKYMNGAVANGEAIKAYTTAAKAWAKSQKTAAAN